MARPKGRQLPHRVSVALTDQQFAALEGLAKESQGAVSWVIRRAIAEYLERNFSPANGDRVTHLSIAGDDDGTGEQQL